MRALAPIALFVLSLAVLGAPGFHVIAGGVLRLPVVEAPPLRAFLPQPCSDEVGSIGGASTERGEQVARDRAIGELVAAP